MLTGPLRIKGWFSVNDIVYPYTVAPASGQVLTSAGPGSNSFYWSSPVASSIFSGNTDAVAEGSTNQYFTNARAITAVTGDASYASKTYVIQVSGNVYNQSAAFAANADAVIAAAIYASIASASGQIPTTTNPRGMALYTQLAALSGLVPTTSNPYGLASYVQVASLSGLVPTLTTPLGFAKYSELVAVSSIIPTVSSPNGLATYAQLAAVSGNVLTYCSARLSANQTTNLGVGGRVNFTAREAGNIPVTSGVFTLSSGVPYKAEAYISDSVSGTDDVYYRWYNITEGYFFDNIVVPSANSTVELRIVSAGVTQVNASGTSAFLTSLTGGPLTITSNLPAPSTSGYALFTNGTTSYWGQQKYGNTIVVDANGGGDFTTLSEALTYARTLISLVEPFRYVTILVNGKIEISSPIVLSSALDQYITITGTNKDTSVLHSAMQNSPIISMLANGTNISNLSLLYKNKSTYVDAPDGAASGVGIHISVPGKFGIKNVKISGFGRALNINQTSALGGAAYGDIENLLIFNCLTGVSASGVGDFDWNIIHVNNININNLGCLLASQGAVGMDVGSGIMFNIDNFYGLGSLGGNIITRQDGNIHVNSASTYYGTTLTSFNNSKITAGSVVTLGDAYTFAAAGTSTIRCHILNNNTSLNDGSDRLGSQSNSAFVYASTTAANTTLVTTADTTKVFVYGFDVGSGLFRIGPNYFPMTVGANQQQLTSNGAGLVTWKSAASGV